MSLLMDALRKAEEAKRKAADTPQGKEPSVEDSRAAEVASGADSSPVTAADAARKNTAEATPAKAPSAKDSPATDFPPKDSEEKPMAEVQEYFSQKTRQTRQSRQRKINGRGTTAQSNSAEPESSAAVTSTGQSPVEKVIEAPVKKRTRTAPENVPVADTASEHPQQPAAETEPTSDGYSRYQELRRNRESAGAVFAAKQSRQGSRSKVYLLATVILGIPVLLTAYWFYKSYTEATSSFIQQSVTVNPGRGFLGEGLESTPRQLPPSETAVTNPLLDTNPQTIASGENTGQPVVSAEAPTPAQSPEISEPVSPEPETPVFALEQNSRNSTPVTTADQRQQQEQPVQQTRQQGYNLQLVRNTQPVRQSQTLQDAYNHLQLGNYTQARQLYQNVLAGSPNNRDALLGVAALYRQENETTPAQRMYSRLLQLNPRDALARAGLIEATLSAGSPAAAEEELLALISANATSAPLHFALGNLYASQKRWSEAESAYFDALAYARSETPDAISPDYAFNLAISLEQLNQLPLAYQYYQQAAAAARVSAAGFDPTVLTRRLLYLEAQLQ